MKEFTTFSELSYERPDFEGSKAFYSGMTKKLKSAKD